MFSALLDANVLVPSPLRDVLLQVAVNGVFRPLWSDGICAELAAAVDAILSVRGVPEGQRADYLSRLLGSMERAFPDARVVVPDVMIGGVWSPDPDDRHVIAAAIVGRADVIVTDDRRGFPEAALPMGLSVQSADVFLDYSIDLHPHLVVAAVETVASRTGRHGPARSGPEIAELLAERGLWRFGARLLGELHRRPTARVGP